MSADSHPVPSGESPLEERLRDLAAGVELSTGVFRSSPTLGQTRATVTLSREAADELARLRSEVARLTAEREEAGRCELCGGLGYVPTRTPDESGEMYDDCRGCDGSGERPTGAQMEELRDRLDARDCDVQIACEASEHHRAEAARYREALEEIRDPVGAMQKRAARDGFRLDGAMAVSMARSASYLQEIARAVLTTEGGDRADTH